MFTATSTYAQNQPILTLWPEPSYTGTTQTFPEPVLHALLAGELPDNVGSLELADGDVAVFTEVHQGGAGPYFTVTGPAKEEDLSVKIEGVPAKRFVSITRAEPEEGVR